MTRIVPLAVGAFVVAAALTVSAQQQTAGVVPQMRALGSKVVSKSSSLATIKGSATNSSNGSLPNSMVRLRDARFGRIVNTTLTDKTGGFSFAGVDPGNYIVEIVGTNQAPIAATQMLSANAGETVTAVVKLPIKPSMFASILGQQGGSTSPAGAGGAVSSVTEAIPQVVEQLPQAAVQSIPAVAPIGAPVSPTR